MALDGSDLKPLGDSCKRLPRLSPNGRLVAYENGNAIHVMNIDGTGSREVSSDLPPVQPTSCGQTPNWHVWPFGWVSASRVAFRRHICGVGTTFFVRIPIAGKDVNAGTSAAARPGVAVDTDLAS